MTKFPWPEGGRINGVPLYFENFELESDVGRLPIAVNVISNLSNNTAKVILIIDAALKSSLASRKRRISDRNEISAKITQGSK